MMLDVPNDLDSQKVVKNNNLINKYLSGPRTTSAESEKSFSYESKKLYQNDDAGYVDLLKRAIDNGLINRKTIFFCRDIKSIKNNDAFLDLAKYVIKADILSDVDRLDLNKEFLERFLRNPENTTLTQHERLSKLSSQSKELYPNNDEYRSSLIMEAVNKRLIDSNDISIFRLIDGINSFMNSFMNSFRDAVNQLLPPNTAMAPTTSATSATSATGSPNRYS